MNMLICCNTVVWEIFDSKNISWVIVTQKISYTKFYYHTFLILSSLGTHPCSCNYNDSKFIKRFYIKKLIENAKFI